MCVAADIWIVMVRRGYGFHGSPSPKAGAKRKGCIRIGVQCHQGGAWQLLDVYPVMHREKTRVLADSWSAGHTEWVPGEAGMNTGSESHPMAYRQRDLTQGTTHGGPEVAGHSSIQQARWR